jgi:hypothetical protein
VGIYSRIDKLESTAVVRKYVETRLQLAGGARNIFADDAFDRLWENSNQGIPRLINKLSKLCLKAGETNGLTAITGDVVDQIGARFHSLTGPAFQKRRSRKRVQETAPLDMPLEIPSEMAGQPDEDPWNTAGEPDGHESGHGVNAESEKSENEAREELSSVSQMDASPASGEQEPTLNDSVEEIEIGNCKIRIDFPELLLRQSLSSTLEHRAKLAGALAAETLKKNPQLITAYSTDPVPIWQEIRNFVLTRFNSASAL